MVTYIVLLRNLFDTRHDLVAGRRIKPAGRLIEIEHTWTGDKLSGYADTALLATADALAKWGPNKNIRLILETEVVDQAADSRLQLGLGMRPALISIVYLH